MLYEANENIKCAVKTPSGLPETRSITNKIMQGDVISPLLSSNFGDVNVVKTAKAPRNIYKFKDQVAIPPLIMQDDTFSVGACGIRNQHTNTMINTCVSMMGLQFGSIMEAQTEWMPFC